MHEEERKTIINGCINILSCVGLTQKDVDYIISELSIEDKTLHNVFEFSDLDLLLKQLIVKKNNTCF